MKTFDQLLKEWGWDGNYLGHKVGNSVRVHKPGDPNHGKIGRIDRQQTVDYGVEMKHQPGKLHWYNAAELHKPESAPTVQ